MSTAALSSSAAGMGLVRRRLLALGGLSLVGAGAGGLVAWQSRHDHLQQEQKNTDERLVDFAAAGSIDKIVLDNSHGHFVLHKSEQAGSWRLVEPRALAADGQAVQTLLSALIDGRILRQVAGEGDGGEPDDKLFGLDQPRLQVALSGADAQTAALKIGLSNSFDSNLFGRRGQRAEVVSVPSSLEGALGRSLFDLRDKQVLHLPSQTLAQIGVSGDGVTPYQLRRVEGAYQLTSPLQAPADRAQAEALAGALTGLRAQSFLAETAADSKSRRPFGLDRPAFVVDITDDTGATERLRVARMPGQASQLAVQAGDLGPVAEVSSDWVAKKLGIGTWELRDKHLLATTAAAVRQLRLQEQEASLLLTRGDADSGDGGVWRLPDGVEADAQKVAGVLQRLVDLQGEGVVHEQGSAQKWAQAGLQAPSLRVTLLGEGERELASLHAAGEHNGTRYVGSAPEAPIWRLSPSALAGIGCDRELFMPAPQPPPAQASKK